MYCHKSSGGVCISPELSRAQVTYMRSFNSFRRVARDVSTDARHRQLDHIDFVRIKAGLPVGLDGEFVIDPEYHYSLCRHPNTQPSDWCPWVPAGSDTLVLNKCTPGHKPVGWLRYIATNFMDRWGLKMNGAIMVTGSQDCDRASIEVDDNVVTVRYKNVESMSPGRVERRERGMRSIPLDKIARKPSFALAMQYGHLFTIGSGDCSSKATATNIDFERFRQAIIEYHVRWFGKSRLVTIYPRSIVHHSDT